MKRETRKSRNLLDEASYCFQGHANLRTSDPMVARSWLSEALTALTQAARIDLAGAWILVDRLSDVQAKIEAFKVVMRFMVPKRFSASASRARFRILAALGTHLSKGGAL